MKNQKNCLFHRNRTPFLSHITVFFLLLYFYNNKVQQKYSKEGKKVQISSNLPANPLAHCLLSCLFHPATKQNTKHFDLLNEFIVISYDLNEEEKTRLRMAIGIIVFFSSSLFCLNEMFHFFTCVHKNI